MRVWVTSQTTSLTIIALLQAWSTETPLRKVPRCELLRPDTDCFWWKANCSGIYCPERFYRRQRGLLSGYTEEAICLLRPSPECKPCSPQSPCGCCCYCYSSLFIEHQKYIMYWEAIMFTRNIVYVYEKCSI